MMTEYCIFCDKQIKLQRENIRYSLIWASGELFLGILISGVLLIMEASQNFPDALKIGPTVISLAISSLQYSPFKIGRERISACEGIKTLIDCECLLDPIEREKLRSENKELIHNAILFYMQELSKR